MLAAVKFFLNHDTSGEGSEEESEGEDDGPRPTAPSKEEIYKAFHSVRAAAAAGETGHFIQWVPQLLLGNKAFDSVGPPAAAGGLLHGILLL